MAQPYASGAVHTFVRFPTSASTIYYLGTCESMPADSRSPEYEPVMNDISGSKVPLDFAFEGQSAQVSMVLTRWNEVIAQSCEIPTVNGVAGSWLWADVGTLMGLEEQHTELWLVYTFGAALANKAAYVANGMLPGRHYLQTILWSPAADETGTKPMKRHFMFYAWPKLNATLKTFTLWDANMTGISSALIT